MTVPTTPAARRWPVSSAILILANTAPLIGVLAHHWTVFAVVLLYWCENVIVGAFNVLRMLCARPPRVQPYAARTAHRDPPGRSRLGHRGPGGEPRVLVLP
jgi:uncharacterized protein DUF6498